MTRRLVALDVPGGRLFVDELQRAWDDGDAVFVVDGRLPAAARDALLGAMEPSAIVDEHGERHRLGGGRPVQDGDALVVATSGSTGTPKGAVLTHDAVAASARLTSRRLGITANDHWLACLPLAHIGGLSVVTRALHTGTALTVLPGFDAAAVDASDATVVSLVATALTRVDPSRFRVIVLGGSAPPAVRPANAVTTYGMTETGSGVVYDGEPLEGVAIRLTSDGEIEVGSPTLLRCYRDGTNPLRDGWFPTGDHGSWDDGRLVVHGRAGHMIVTGGENVWPDPVEAALRRHPAIADAGVVGLADDTWGQAVTALVTIAPDADGDPPSLEELRDHVKATLPSHAAPHRLIVVSTLPRTALGKLRRDRLSQLAHDAVAERER